MNRKSIDLINIVNTSILQKLPDAFYKATGLCTAIQNISGELITDIPPEHFCDFCRSMFFSREGHKKCAQSNANGARKAYEIGGPYIYHCHTGLIDVAAPIVVEGFHVGSVSCGQIILKPPNLRYYERVQKRLACFSEEFQKMQLRALEKVPVMDLSRIRAVAQLLYAVANNVVNLIINNMMEKEINIQNIRKLDEIKSTYLLEKEIKNAKLRVKEMELKALEAQINPHFLYNTLDSIQWLAVMHGAEDIQKMIYALGQLLRHSLDRKRGIVRLGKELEQIENYLFIQKIRYGDKVSFQINVEPEILEFRIPKLVLQPLVENSIEHGIEPKGTSGKISISGWLEKENEAIVEIADDGVGMPETLQESLVVDNGLGDVEYHLKSSFTRRQRIGLANIQKRMAYYYGDDNHFIIRSRKDYGTTVRLKIPFYFKQDD